MQECIDKKEDRLPLLLQTLVKHLGETVLEVVKDDSTCILEDGPETHLVVTNKALVTQLLGKKDPRYSTN